MVLLPVVSSRMRIIFSPSCTDSVLFDGGPTRVFVPTDVQHFKQDYMTLLSLMAELRSPVDLAPAEKLHKASYEQAARCELGQPDSQWTLQTVHK